MIRTGQRSIESEVLLDDSCTARDRRNRHYWIGWTVAAALLVLSIAFLWGH